MIQITSQAIDVSAVLQDVQSHAAGAVLLFLGTTREITGDQRTVALDYECYQDMAEVKLRELESACQQRWSLTGCAIVHRVGRVDPGEVSVAIAVSSSHREEAFEAGRWLIDTLKEVVPIWKRESRDDGSQQWVHPGMLDRDTRSDDTP